MGLNYENLDLVTRQHMIGELDLDIKENRIYFSKRFNSVGKSNWESLLREAILSHNDDWLANELQTRECFLQHETVIRQGKQIIKKVPYDAAITCAEGEFNRFYARGLCSRAISEGIQLVEVYRGKIVRTPRAESEMKIGQTLLAKQLLQDLRTSHGVEPALGIPPGPNSGLTVRLIKKEE